MLLQQRIEHVSIVYTCKLTGNHAITVARYSLVPLFTLYL